MNRRAWLIATILLLLVALAVAVFFFRVETRELIAPVITAVEGEDKVTMLAGTGQWHGRMLAGTGQWHSVKPGTSLAADDQVVAAVGGRARIAFAAMGEMELDAGATLGVEASEKTKSAAFWGLGRAETRRRMILHLDSGRLIARLTHRPEGAEAEYRIHTPIAVAGVRGTTFAVQVDHDAAWAPTSVTVIVLSGEVEVTSLPGAAMAWSRIVPAGCFLMIFPGLPPGEAQPCPPERVNSLTPLTEFLERLISSASSGAAPGIASDTDVLRIADRFYCLCSRMHCIDRNLSAASCNCAEPRGGNEIKAYIRSGLQRGMSDREVFEAVKAHYGGAWRGGQP